MEKKMTKVQMFNAIKAEVAENAEMVAFLDKEIALVEKRNSNRKLSKTQIANEELKATMIDVMTGANPMTVTEVLKKMNDDTLSPQKVSALMKQLVDNGSVVKTIEKRKSYFAVA